MKDKKIQLKNCLVLLMGFPGVGKRTIGEVLARKTNACSSDHRDLFDPILKLLGNDYHVMWDLTPEMWKKLNAVQDIYLSTIADACAQQDSFVLTEMMFDKDQYHTIFYNKVLEVVKKRNAHFFPIRLICDADELAKRVQSEDRKKYFKTRDVELSKKRSRELQVFYSNHSNEMTVDNTNLSADLSADKIIEYIQKKIS